jgi:hypothetical protein
MTTPPDTTTDEQMLYIDSNLPIGGINAIRQPDGTIVVVLAQKQLTPEQADRLLLDMSVLMQRVHLWANESGRGHEEKLAHEYRRLGLR